MSVTQRDATRNQSTADYNCKRIFLFDNNYQDVVFKNNTAGDLVLKPGSLVLRDTATPSQVIPAVAGATLANVIGIVNIEEEVTLAAGATLNISMAISGEVDETHLELPDTVTLDAVPTSGTKSLRDYLQALGFSLKASVNNTKYDN